MRIIRHYDIPPQDIADFVSDCRDKHIKDFTTQWNKDAQMFNCTITLDESYSVHVILDLLEIAHTFDLTYEQRESINDAISAIKTLNDMGVLS